MKLLKTCLIFALSAYAQEDIIEDNTQIEPPQYEEEPEPVVSQSEADNSVDQSADEPVAAEEIDQSEPAEEIDQSELEETDQTESEETDQSELEEENDQSEEGKTSDNEEFETQTVKTKLTVGEKAHNMCDLALVDTNVYRCDETEDEFLRCTADCPSGAGIIKKNCECYKYWGPLVLYDPENCIWNAFDDQCFDEDPIPVGGYPDAECTDCDIVAKPIDQSEPASPPVQSEPEEEESEETTTNPKFARPVKFVSDNQEEGDSWFSAEDLDDKAHFSGFLRHLDRWAKLTLVAVEQGEMQPVMYQQL